MASNPPSQPPSLRVPSRLVEPLRRLAEVDDGTFGAIVGALGEPIKPSPPELAVAVRDAAPAIEEEATGIVQALLGAGVVQTRNAWAPADMARAIAASDEFSEVDRSLLADRVGAALGAPSMMALAKASAIAFANEKTFDSARILTEMRPIFGDDVSAPPPAGVIVHSLEITYAQDGDIKSVFFVVDDRDLVMLRGVVERAQEKSRSLRTTLEAAGIRQLDWNMNGLAR